MSRSLVGSSSSSTLGSRSRSRSSCSRRRSPPERSPIRAVSRSPVNPNRSSIEVAVISRPDPTRATRRISSTDSSTRCEVSRSPSAWLSSATSTVRPRFTRPACGAASTGEHRQHRGLARPVDTDQADPVARPEPPGRVVDEHPAPALDRRIFEVEHVLAQAGRGEPLERHRVARRRLVGDQRLGGVDAELRLRRAGRRTPAQPGQLLARQVEPPRLRGRVLALALGPGQDVRRIAAFVAVDRGVVHLPGRRTHRVEEPAVVGDHDERQVAAQQRLSEPGDRLDVEVVGRLVQQQHVEVTQQQRRQRDPPALPTREAVDRAVEGDAGQQVLDHGSGGGVGGPLVLGPVAEDDVGDGGFGVEVVVLAEQGRRAGRGCG